MKKYHILIYAVLFAKIALSQQQVSISEAQIAAKNYLCYLDANNNDLEVEHVYIIENVQDLQRDTLVYEVEFDNGDYVMLSGSKACVPVLGYGYKSSIIEDLDNIPCGLRFFMDSYLAQITECFANVSINLYHSDEWNELLFFDETNTSLNSNSGMAPLLTSKWGQSEANDGLVNDAYNQLTPLTTVCDFSHHCPAGCCAVAVGQVMNYWKYPIYNPFADEQFDWCNMADELNPGDDYDIYIRESHAVSFLLRYLGNKFNMRYCDDGDCASSADLEDAETILENFGYSDNLIYRKNTWLIHDDDWKQMIRNDIDRYWPVLYSGHGSGGHSFVCDGYANDKFHFNFGWTGICDGYYEIGSLTFYDNMGVYHNYKERQSAVFRIRPDDNSYFSAFCNYSNSLLRHYDFYYNGVHHNHNSNIPPYRITPKTFAELISVSSSAPADYRTIPDSAEAEYVAHKFVLLQDGFWVQRGAEFTVRIDSCSRCFAARNNQDLNTEEKSIQYDINMSEDNAKLSINNDKQLRVLPNPAASTITVEALFALSVLHIIDCNGIEVMKKVFVDCYSSKIVIDISKFSAGIYLIRCEDYSGCVYMEKFIKM